MSEQHNRNTLDEQANTLYDRLAALSGHVSPVELVLHCPGENAQANYYFVDHERECLFWVDDFNDLDVTDKQQMGQSALASAYSVTDRTTD